MARLSHQQAACTLAQAGWPQALIPDMVAIGEAESGLETRAQNMAGEVASAVPTGWLQVRAFPDRIARWNLLDPVGNAQAGLAVYEAQGLGAWSTYPQQSAQFLSGVQRDLAGFDYSKCGSQVKGRSTGSGLLAGRQVDPWGIGQGIADAVGYTGSAAGVIGRQVEAGGTLLIGLVVLGLGLAAAAWMLLNDTAPGRGLKRAAKSAGEAAAAAVALAPK